jgi:hypothetical protein
VFSFYCRQSEEFRCRHRKAISVPIATRCSREQPRVGVALQGLISGKNCNLFARAIF